MTDATGDSGKTWRYRFVRRPGDSEVETGDFPSDDGADEHARELSKSLQSPIVVERWHGISWEYVTEADEGS